jgi:hypothetical protein
MIVYDSMKIPHTREYPSARTQVQAGSEGPTKKPGRVIRAVDEDVKN